MKTKNMGITIFIFTCIFRHKVLEYPTNYQQHSQITGLYFHSNLTKVHSIPYICIIGSPSKQLKI